MTAMLRTPPDSGCQFVKIQRGEGWVKTWWHKVLRTVGESVYEEIIGDVMHRLSEYLNPRQRIIGHLGD